MASYETLDCRTKKNRGHPVSPPPFYVVLFVVRGEDKFDPVKESCSSIWPNRGKQLFYYFYCKVYLIWSQLV